MPRNVTDFYPNAPDPQQSELLRALMAHVGASPRPDLAAMTLASQNDPTGPAAFNPTNGMSTLGLATAGAGQGLSDVNLKSAQFLADNPVIAHALGYGAYASPEVKKGLDRVAKDKEDTDALLLEKPAGRVGSIAGQAAALALFK